MEPNINNLYLERIEQLAKSLKEESARADRATAQATRYWDVRDG